MRRFNVAGNYLLAATVLFFLLISNVHPQLCPDPPPDYDIVPFEYGGCYETAIVIGGNSCDAEICYCYRIVVDGIRTFYDFYISSVSLLQPSCAGGATPDEILRAASAQFAEDNPQDFPCAVCPLTGFNWRIANSLCATWGPNGEPTVIPCLGNSKFCFEVYSVCCDEFGRHVTELGSFGTGDCPVPPAGGFCWEVCQ